jgi:hypothetical protein
MQMLKKRIIFINFTKIKNYFFANICLSQFESHLVLKMEIPNPHSRRCVYVSGASEGGRILRKE